VQQNRKRQIIVTTHSAEILSDRGGSLSEILLLQTNNEGTSAELASQKTQIKVLLEGGLTPAEAVLPSTRPEIHQGGCCSKTEVFEQLYSESLGYSGRPATFAKPRPDIAGPKRN
jgi:hypothetical protein